MNRGSTVGRLLRIGPAALLLALTGGSPSLSIAQTAAPAEQTVSPAIEQRTGEIVHLIRSGDRAAAAAWASTALGPRLMEEPDSFLHFISSYHDRSGGIDDVRIDGTGEDLARVTLKSALTGRWLAFGLRIEPEQPHRVLSLGPRLGTPPEDYVASVPATEEERLAAIDRFAAKLAAADQFSGVVLIARGGVPVLERAFGLADRTGAVPNTMDTRFNLGSMNKVFTALAIGRLVEQGRLAWDDPLSKFMPALHDTEGVDKIRIKHLLSHTSGLGSYFNERFAATPMSQFRDIDSYMAVVGEEPLRFEPGKGWFYSNTGMLLLGRVIEAVTGDDYYEHIRRTIYEPAGMASTDSYLLDQPEPGTAVPYEVEYTDDGRVFVDARGMLPVRGSPAGGGLSTARDLLRFSNALSSGKLVRPETLALMAEPKTELGASRYGYGLAIERFAARGRPIFGHGGDAEGTCAVWGEVRDTAVPYTVIILSNSRMASCHPLAERVYELLPPAG